MMKNSMDIKKAMIDYRAKNGLSMGKAAQKAGIALQTWMYVERGLQEPSRLTAAKIEAVVVKGEDE